MSGVLSIAKTALDASQKKIANTANNLANINTKSFKKGRLIFQDTMYRKLKQSGVEVSDDQHAPMGITLGTGVKLVASEKIFTQGEIKKTSNPYDIAIQGRGFFKVSLGNGTVGYTREGNLKTDSSGNLVTANGLILEPGIRIPDDADNISIGKNGVVKFTRSGYTGEIIAGTIELTKFINPAGLEPIGENLYIETVASGVPIDGVPNENGFGYLEQGLEMANVNTVEELVELMEGQQHYQHVSQLFKVEKENSQTLLGNTR